MSDYEIDHEAVRARVEKRLKPQIRLWRRRRWLIALIAGFVLFTKFVNGPYSYYGQILEQLGWVYWDSTHFTFVRLTSIDPIGVAAILWVAWGILIPFYTVSLFLAFGRERAVQREISREMELEKMRLQLAVARAQNSTLSGDEEKPKRTVGLSDDGELLFDDENHSEPVRRNQNYRSS